MYDTYRDGLKGRPQADLDTPPLLEGRDAFFLEFRRWREDDAPVFLEVYKERSFPPQMPFPSSPKYCGMYWPSFTKIKIKLIEKKYIRKPSMCRKKRS